MARRRDAARAGVGSRALAAGPGEHEHESRARPVNGGRPRTGLQALPRWIVTRGVRPGEGQALACPRGCRARDREPVARLVVPAARARQRLSSRSRSSSTAGCRLRRRRADLAPWTRIPLFVAGVVVTVLAIVSPIDAIGEEYLQIVAHAPARPHRRPRHRARRVVAVRGPLTVFFLPRDLLVPLARVALAARGCSASCCGPGSATRVWVVVLVAWHVPPLLRGDTAPPRLARPHARELRRRRAARLDADHRPRRGTIGSRLSERLGVHGARLLDGPDHGLRDPVRLRAALPDLRRPARAAARPLAAHRPEARRGRDDGRAGRSRSASPSSCCCAPRAARSATASRSRPRPAVVDASPWSFTFEPLFVVLGAAALVGSTSGPGAASTPAPARAVAVRRRRRPDRARRSTRRSRRSRSSTSCSSTCCRT